MPPRNATNAATRVGKRAVLGGGVVGLPVPLGDGCGCGGLTDFLLDGIVFPSVTNGWVGRVGGEDEERKRDGVDSSRSAGLCS